MASNGRALWSAGQEIQNESLIRNIVTQTTTGDLVWKIDCANAGSNCSKFGSAQLLAQGDVASALRHEAMRAALVGAGQVGGIGGRAVDTVTGLGELLGESNTVVQGLRVWSALEYVNEHGLAAYIELEQAKSRDMRQALFGSAKDYFGDIGSALQNNALGGPQWDIYDVLMQGNTEGKVGFDVASLFFGGAEANAFSKIISANRTLPNAIRGSIDLEVPVVRVNSAASVKGSPEYSILNYAEARAPNTKYELDTGTSFVTNGSGQVETLTFTPVDIKMPRDSRQTEVGKQGRPTDVGGHAQACSQGGTCDGYNLFPQDRNFNVSAYRAFYENVIQRALDDPSKVVGPTQIKFSRADPGARRPDSLEVTYTIDGRTYKIDFENEPNRTPRGQQ